MNNIYKVIWSKAKNCYVVASEIARSHTKSATGSGKIGGVTRRSLLASLMALSLLCGGLGVASAANSTVHVDESASGAAEVYTRTGVDTLLADYGRKTDVDNNKNNIRDLQTTTTEHGEKITANATNIARNTADIGKKIDTETANERFAAKVDLTALQNQVTGKVDENTFEDALEDKADKTYVDTEVGKKADKTYVDTEVGKKANKATTLTGYGITDAYTKDATDTAITTKVNEEKDARELKDTELSGRIDTLSTTVNSKVSKTDLNTTLGNYYTQAETNAAIKTAVDDEKNARENAINGEVTSRNKAIADAIALEETNRDAAITKEETKRKEEDAKLEGKITENTTAINNEKTDREAADIDLSKRIGTVTDDGKYIKKSDTNNVSENLKVLDKQAKMNADAIAQEVTNRETAVTNAKKELEDKIQTNANNIKSNKDEIARVNGELVKTNDYFNSELGKTNDYFNKELGKTNNHFNTELGKTNAALQATNKRTAGIGRTDTGVEAGNQTVIEDKVYFDQNGNVSGVKDLQTDTIHATGEITSKGLDAGAGEIKTQGKVSAGDVSTGTLETTGNAKIGGDLTVNGKLNVGEIYMEQKKQESTGEEYDSATSITADGISNNAKVTDRNGVTTESKFTHDKEGSTTYAYQGDAANWKKSTSNVTADGVENVAEDSKGNNNTFTQTSTDTKNILKDKDGNTSTTRQDSKGIYGYAKDKDGNKSYTKQEGNRIAESVIGQDGKQTKSEMTSTDITNTAKDGTITNTAKNVTNEGTESVTNTVGGNEVKVSQDGVDIKAEAGKKITESVGTASRVVENAKITDNAGDSTVTTEKDKGTTFGKAGITGTTNIYGDSIKTGTINAEDTITDKLTAGAAADAEGGRLTVDADDGVKGSYKFGKYTSKSYILANTLKSGVDNGKKPTDADFVGSRTDHYMVGDKAKLDETVKDADGSNVTNKTSTGTVTTITDGTGTTTTKTEQGVKDITNTATDGTIKNDAKVITNKASEVINNEAININNTATGIIKSKASVIQNQADRLISNKVGENTWENMEDGKITTSIKNGTKQNLTQSDAEKTEHSVVNGSNSTVNKQTSEEITDAVTNGTTTNVTQNTATSSNNTIADKNGNANTVISTADGTSFINSKAAAPVTGESGAGTAVNTTIKGNTITTGKVTMDYAEVMKNLGVNGNANIGGKTTTGSLEVTGTSTLKGDVTMGSNATVNGNFNVKGDTNLKNTKVDGTLKVTQMATFDDSVSIAKDLSVDGNATIKGDVTASSYKVGDKTYIDADGIHANNQKITNVADGSISEGSKDAVNGGQLYSVKNDLEGKVNKVGANAAAMANLHPMEFDPDSKWNIAAAIGNYGSETAAALGAFYRPNDDVMVNLSTAFGTGENMVGGGVSVRLGKGGNKLSREETNALKAQVADLTARMDALLSVLNPNMSKDFPDVPENHWAYEAVSRLAGNDIVQGYPDGEFHGERTMTRYEMAEIIYNALSRGAEAEKELVEEFKPELQAMAASEKATAEKAEG